MPWKPDIPPGEVVLVSCNVQARRGVSFHVVLTDKQLVYARPSVWSVDGKRTESQPLWSLTQARLRRLRPYALWAFGLFAAAGFAAAVAAQLMQLASTPGWFVGVGMLAAAAFSFGGARKRVRLTWRGAGRRRSLTTPVGSHDGVRAQMADALREIERLLGDRNQLALKAREVHLERESEQDRDPAVEDRQLCPDGECTGVLGSDGRCRTCGLSP